MCMSEYRISTESNKFCKIVYSPSHKFMIWGVPFMLGLMVVFYLMMTEGSPSSSKHYLYMLVGFLGFMFSILACIACFFLVVFDLPKLVLDHKGITYRTLFNKRSWSWSEPGSFHVCIVETNGTPFYWACAFTRDNLDRMSDVDRERIPEYKNADIRFGLNNLAPVDSLDTAQGFVDKLNDWRDDFGNPEGDHAHEWSPRVTELQRRKTSKHVVMPQWKLFLICVVSSMGLLIIKLIFGY